MTSASYFLVEAALLEERISDARRLVEEGQALAKVTKVDEARTGLVSKMMQNAQYVLYVCNRTKMNKVQFLQVSVDVGHSEPAGQSLVISYL